VICPVCHTHNSASDPEACQQCGSDLWVHGRLQQLKKEMSMNTEPSSTIRSNVSCGMQILPIFASSLVLLGIGFGLFLGLRFLNLLDRVELTRTLLVDKWSETGLESWQQLQKLTQQAFEMVQEQNRENQALHVELRLLRQQLQTVRTDARKPLQEPEKNAL
jgi:hypothetical protein